MSRCILIGIDGMDPTFSEELMEQGKLPAFCALKNLGGFKRLKTSNPAQSPVAWSSLATGVNPGGHGMFDFITRDPNTYLPTLSILKPNTKGIFGIRSEKFLPVRHGTAFWTTTSQHHIPTSVIKWPITFPPEEISNSMLSGLGVPDIKNNLGRYTLFASSPKNIHERKGDVIIISNFKNSTISLTGPNKTMVPIQIHPAEKSVEIEINARTVRVDVEKWSSWQEIEFEPLIGQSMLGLCKFYLKSITPEIELYMTPLHIHPRKPISPISYPDTYSNELLDDIGPFHTLGLPEETNGLVDECFSHEAFLAHAMNIHEEREKMFWHEFERMKEGLLAFVFDTSDRLQHVFWNQEKDILTQYYQKMDALIGQVLQKLNPNDVLLVVSDHGFSSFKTSLHINSFLRDHGWLVFQQNKKEGLPLFKNIDWKKTRAYAVGFSSIFLNLKGREKYGIIQKEKSKETLEQLRTDLSQWETIENVYLSEEIYSGAYVYHAPDIVFGTKPGCRASWQTALGAAPENLTEKNDKAWQADHIVDPSHVSGVCFSNVAIQKQTLELVDIAPTILKFFSLTQPDDMEGKSIF